MGVYIHGMEMPKKYPVTVTIFPDGITIAKTISGRRFTATAIPVKPHGRLIDADALAEKHRELAYELRGANYDFHMTAKSWVDNAPTIIPAEEGEG